MRPHIWEHKETKKRVRVVPWWEIPDDEDFVKELGIADALKDKEDTWKDRRFKIGALIQVGWLLENEHQVWLGVGPKAKDSFNDLGEEPKKEPKDE